MNNTKQYLDMNINLTHYAMSIDALHTPFYSLMATKMMIKGHLINPFLTLN